MKNKIIIGSIVLLLLIGIVFIGRSYSLEYNKEIKSIEIESKNYPEPGSYHIDKSAKWISNGKAQVTFEVNPVMQLSNGYKDVILVLDVSGSMGGEKIAKVKQDATELVELLLSDTHNRVALIDFESSSYLEFGFSNDKDMVIDKIQHLYIYDSTNYNAALKDVDTIMKDYVKEDNRTITVMFLTDGFPNIDINNQISTYHLLKEKYPYLEINGVQYEMGSKIIKEIKDISDNQWSAFVQTLHNVLFEASLSPKKYTNFVITDYIDDEYFYLESVDDIEVDMGSVRLDLENGIQKITWNLSGELTTLSKPKMNIKLSLKDKYKGQGGFFPTNKKETVVSKLDDNEENINSNDTPVLKGQYNVIYDVNTPNGCTVNNIDSEKYFPFENVTKKNYSIKCEGYNLIGWSVHDDDNKDITYLNEDTFVMPSHDVKIVATWNKITPFKSMSGEVKQSVNTLFDVMRLSAVPDDRPSQYVTGENGIDFTQEASNTNGRGAYELRNNMVVSDAENVPIYYFRGQVDNDFVLFAGYCWQIVRTTPNKGVKLLYFGEPTGENKDQCNSSPRYLRVEEDWLPEPQYFYSSSNNYVNGFRNGYVEEGGTRTYGGWMINNNVYDIAPYSIYVKLNSDYYFGSHIYTNATNGNFYFSSEYNYNESTGKYSLVNPTMMHSSNSEVIGKYTLLSTNSDATSDQIYYVSMRYTSNSSQYNYLVRLRNNTPLSNYRDAQFGSGITENNDGTYTLSDITSVDLTRYLSNMSITNNKYMCPDLTSTCKDPIYILNTLSSSHYFNSMDASKKIRVSTSINTNPISVNVVEWINNSTYDNYKYICTGDSVPCNDKDWLYVTNKYVGTSSDTGYEANYRRYYARSVTWDGSKYHLVTTAPFEANVNSIIGQLHYVCPELNQTECENVLYVVNNRSSNMINYLVGLKLENGEMSTVNVFNKRKEIQVDANKNPINGSYDSNFKVILDGFYEAKLMDYDKYIDDAAWCNDRVFDDAAYQDSYLNPNSNESNIYKQLRYKAGERLFTGYGFYDYNQNLNKPVLQCKDKLDSYTVNDKVHGNGFLKHPIALITGDEVILSGLSARDSYINEGSDSGWFTMTPAYNAGLYEGYLFRDSSLWTYGDVSRNVKPSIVLKPNIQIKSGDGTKNNPYQLDLQ